VKEIQGAVGLGPAGRLEGLEGGGRLERERVEQRVREMCLDRPSLGRETRSACVWSSIQICTGQDSAGSPPGAYASPITTTSAFGSNGARSLSCRTLVSSGAPQYSSFTLTDSCSHAMRSVRSSCSS